MAKKQDEIRDLNVSFEVRHADPDDYVSSTDREKLADLEKDAANITCAIELHDELTTARA